MKALISTDYFGLAGIFRLDVGKVRDIYDLGNRLLIIATDRVSAFDVVLPTGIPGRGIILTKMTVKWLEYLSDLINNLATTYKVRHHIISTDVKDLPEAFQPFALELEGRFMIVEKCLPMPIEFILRAYISGSWWKEYLKLIEASDADTVMLHGYELPRNLQESQAFGQTIFAPSTKAAPGTHDENIDEAEMARIIEIWLNGIGRTDLDPQVIVNDTKLVSVGMFETGGEYARHHGIIVPDTKFELALALDPSDTSITVVDEVLSPDSSRFWLAMKYEIGRSQESLDKQILRDWLETLDWDKTAPGPKIPDEIVEKMAHGYQEVMEMLFAS